MWLHFQYSMINILINIIISNLIYIHEFDNATTFKHQSISLFWYLDNILEKDKTGMILFKLTLHDDRL